MLRRKQPCSVGDVFAFCWTLYIQAKGQYFFAELACTVFLVLKKIQRSNLKLKSNYVFPSCNETFGGDAPKVRISRFSPVGAKFALQYTDSFAPSSLSQCNDSSILRNYLPESRCAKGEGKTPKVVKCYILSPSGVKPACTSKGEKVLLHRYYLF